MEEVRRAGVRVDEEGAAPGLVLVPRQQRGAEPLEHRLAGMEPDHVRPIRGSIDRETAVRADRVDFHGGEHGIQALPAFLGEPEDAVRIAVDAQIDQRRGGRDEPADVARQQPAVLLPVDGRLQSGQAALHVAAAEPRLLALAERPHLRRRQQSVDPLDGRGRALLRRRLLQVVLQRHVLEQAAHDVEDLVRLEFPALRGGAPGTRRCRGAR